VVDWYGDFELRLAELAPELFKEFRSPPKAAALSRVP